RKKSPTRSASEGSAGKPATTPAGDLSAQRPVLPPEIVERFVCRRTELPPGGKVGYRPALLGQAKVHFAQAAAGIDVWQDIALLLPIDQTVPAETWAKSEDQEDGGPDLESQPEAGAAFAALPGELSRPKRYTELATALKDHLYRSRKLKL